MKLVFVGQFTNRKGIDLFARALAGLNNLDWTLTLVGDGPLRRTVFDLLASEGMTNRVEWVGNVANESALEKIAGSDWLVLPSRFDGWGAVVNEALLMGTRAIVSSRCGAADIVRSSHAGKVFLHGSESDLREKLGEAMKECFASYETRQSIRAWSLKHIDPRVVALHVNRLFEHCISGQVYSGEAPWLIPSTRENIEA